MTRRTGSEHPGRPAVPVLNGIQTQSAQTYNLIRELDELSQLGVDVLRIGPQSEHTLEIVDLFRQCLARTIGADPAHGKWKPDAGAHAMVTGRQAGLDQVMAPNRAEQCTTASGSTGHPPAGKALAAAGAAVLWCWPRARATVENRQF